MLERLALWLATYAVHSTVLLSGAWILARSVPALAERLWRSALFGSVLTATLHAGGYLPRPVYLELPGLGVSRAQEPAPLAAAVPSAAAPSSATIARPDRSALARTSSPSPAGAGSASPAVADSPRSTPALPLERWTALAWLAAAAVSLGIFGYRGSRFRRRLLARRRPAGGDARSLLGGLVRRSGFSREVRLSLVETARVPMARGWWQPEICLPRALERALSFEELEAALAHELAHLERHDPAWRAAARTLAAALPFQPLNHLACRALEHEAELRCDDRAAALTGRPLVLARCLTRVAGWASGHRPAALPALAAEGSALRRRVLRLLEGRPRSIAPRWANVAAALPVAVVLALAPGLGASPLDDGRGTPAPRAGAIGEGSSDARGAGSGEAGDPVRTDVAPVIHPVAPPVLVNLLPAPPAPPVPAPPASAARAGRVPAVPAAPVVPGAPVLPPAPVVPRAPAGAAAPPAPAVAPAARATGAPAPAPAAPVTPLAPADPVIAAPAPAAPEPFRTAALTPAQEPAGKRGHEREGDAGADEDTAEEASAADAELEEALERIEAELEEAMEGVESALEQQLEPLEDAIDESLDGFEHEIERSLEPLEQRLEALEVELEASLESGDRARTAEISRRMGELGTVMGDLGNRVGELVGNAGIDRIGEQIHDLVTIHTGEIARLARAHAEIEQRLAGAIHERHRAGRELDATEVEALRAELERALAATAPQRDELELRIRELSIDLEPTLESVKRLGEGIARELEEWRLRHHETLRELEPAR